jgi:hypothetical protein
MSFRVFHILARGDTTAESELNGFLNSHRILSVKRRLIDHDGSCYWTFCVDYLEGSSRTRGAGSKSSQQNRIDYREVLSPEDFAQLSSETEFPRIRVRVGTETPPIPSTRFPAEAADAARGRIDAIWRQLPLGRGQTTPMPVLFRPRSSGQTGAAAPLPPYCLV